LADKLNVTVIGDGGWGTALSLVLAEAGHQALVWSPFEEQAAECSAKRENVRFLPGVALPESVRFTADVGEAVAAADMFVCAVPTIYMRSCLSRFVDAFPSDRPVVSVAKGIENGTLMRATEIIADVLGPVPMSVLCGPSHAEEVARRLPTTVVASSRDPGLARRVQHTFITERFRVYTNSDVIGVEVGAALKNVIAIAAGICDGLGFGDNSKAALITRGLAEITRLGCAMGAQRATFAGLTGLGDLITTCVSPFGRNRHVGEQIAKGKTLQQVIDDMHGQVAEGVRTTESVCALADRCHVETPIAREVAKVLFRGKPALEAVSDLMMRSPKSEVEALD